MRNCINLMIMEANDIYSSFGSTKSNIIKGNLKFSPYYSGGMKAYLKYQHQLHSDLYEEFDTGDIDGFQSLTFVKDDFTDILLGESNIFYSQRYGNYLFIMVDQRYELYHRNITMSSTQLKWINNIIKKSECQNIILVSPRPIGVINKIVAQIYGYISCDGYDDLFHPNNYDQTLELINILNKYHLEKDIKIVSGYIRKTFINDIINQDNNTIVAKQLVTGAITRVPKGNDSLPKRFINWLMRKATEINFENYRISGKNDISNGNSFGFIENDELSNHTSENFDNLYCSCLSLN